MTGLERFWNDAAYLAALVVWLIEHKDDDQADAEIAAIMNDKKYMHVIVVSVLYAYRP